MSVLPSTGHGGISIDAAVYAALPRPFVDWYQATFQGTRMIYGHWSGGLYTRATGVFHRQVAVLRPLDLDTLVERYIELHRRRIGGAISAMWHQIEQMKQDVELQVFENAPYERDLAEHTRGRDSGSVAIGLMCGFGAKPNDLGQAAPLPAQLRALVTLVAEACATMRTPVERFLTHSEAADNLDFTAPDDASAPTSPYGFRTTREACDLEAWIDPESGALSAPLATPRPNLMRLGDWIRAEAVRALAVQTRDEWSS